MAVNGSLGDIWEAKLYCFRGQQLSVNVRHYKVTASAGAGITDFSFASTLSTTVAPKYKAFLSNEATFYGVGVRRIRPLPPSPETITTADTGIGLRISAVLPKQTCGIITLRTAVGGSRGRGRVYTPFAPEDGNGNTGIPDGAYVVLLQGLADVLITPLPIVDGVNSATFSPVLYHRLFGTGDPLTSAVARPRWATQKSRGDYGRPNALPG